MVASFMRKECDAEAAFYSALNKSSITYVAAYNFDVVLREKKFNNAELHIWVGGAIVYKQ